MNESFLMKQICFFYKIQYMLTDKNVQKANNNKIGPSILQM
jgi:hypothetical protein